jgi:hypothetical protein
MHARAAGWVEPLESAVENVTRVWVHTPFTILFLVPENRDRGQDVRRETLLDSLRSPKRLNCGVVHYFPG